MSWLDSALRFAHALLVRVWPQSSAKPEADYVDGFAARQGTSAGEAQRRASKGPFTQDGKP